jgi:Ca2+-binding RTX toxin-like protein
VAAVSEETFGSAYSFTITLSKASTAAQTVGWAVLFGAGEFQATADDFTGTLTGTARIAAGATSVTVTVGIAADSAVEGNEEFSMGLLNPSTGTLITGGKATAVISDDPFRNGIIDETALALTGDREDNTLSGGQFGDRLHGLGGNDTLSGMDGNDVLFGGGGQDILSGGAGTDVFRFENARQATMGEGADRKSDVITDFETITDRVDLSVIDADQATSGDEAFTFIGTKAFGSGTGGELRFRQVDREGTAADFTLIIADTDGLPGSEFVIRFSGLVDFTRWDFIL